MKLRQWTFFATLVLGLLRVVEAQETPPQRKWIAFNPSVTQEENVPPRTSVLPVPAAGMVVGPNTKAPFDPARGVYFDDVLQRAVNPTDPGMVLVDPNTCLLVNIAVFGMFEERILKVVRSEEGGGAARMALDLLTMPGGGTLAEVGRPDLPVLGRFLEVPLDADPCSIKAVVVRSVPVDIILENPVYPAQPPVARQENAGNTSLVIDRRMYESDVNFPETPPEIHPEEVDVVRGHQFVFLRVRPVRVNPLKNKAIGYLSLEVALTYTRTQPDSVVNRALSQSLPESMLKSQGVEGSTRTDNMQATAALGEEAQQWPDYLILTPEMFYSPEDSNDLDDPSHGIARLADWKRRKGYVTQVVTLAEIPRRYGPGAIQANDIKEYLQTVYNRALKAHQVPPTYVLLVGDTGDDQGKVLLPTNYWYDSREFEWVGTDLPYGLLEGRGGYPDLCVGRLSVDTREQANTVIDKILAYERHPPATQGYYARVPLVQLFEDGNGDSREDMNCWIVKPAESIWEHLSNQGYDVQRIYRESRDVDDTVPRKGPWYYSDGDPLPGRLRLSVYRWNGSTADIMAAFDRGCCLLAYNGHGERDGWVRPALTAADIAGLANGSLTPIVLSLACKTGWFDNETDFFDQSPYPVVTTDVSNTTPNSEECFCERLLRRLDGGAVAVIGSSRNSYKDNDHLIRGMFGAVWPGLLAAAARVDPNLMPGESTNGAWVRMGQLHTYGRFFMQQEYPVLPRRHFALYNLLGDPEMPFWTREPNDLAVVYSPTMEASGSQDTVDVSVRDATNGAPVAGAIVVLTCPGRALLFRQKTGSEGSARFVLAGPGLGRELLTPPLDLNVTVTASNYRPHLGIIQAR